jgi:hypothetical protein
MFKDHFSSAELHLYQGCCACQQVGFEISLSQPLGDYQQRQCDCDFCTDHNIVWLSDNKGSVCYLGASSPKVNFLVQGDNAAEFIQCAQCQVIIGVQTMIGKTVYSAVNAQCLPEDVDFSKSSNKLIVSPKTLTLEQKQSRWQQVWFKNAVHQGERKCLQ